MQRQDNLPIEVCVAGRAALIVGGDSECASKIERLLAAGAVLTVVAAGPVDPAIVAYADAGRVRLHRRALLASDSAGVAITFVAPDDEATGEKLFRDALDDGRLVCCLDRPERSTFVNPSVFGVSGLRITLSSGGRSPGLLRRLREELTSLLGDPRLERFLSELDELRRRLPRGERAERMREAVRGFRVRGTLEFPEWFGGAPPRGDD